MASGDPYTGPLLIPFNTIPPWDAFGPYSEDEAVACCRIELSCCPDPEPTIPVQLTATISNFLNYDSPGLFTLDESTATVILDEDTLTGRMYLPVSVATGHYGEPALTYVRENLYLDVVIECVGSSYHVVIIRNTEIELFPVGMFCTQRVDAGINDGGLGFAVLTLPPDISCSAAEADRITDPFNLYYQMLYQTFGACFPVGMNTGTFTFDIVFDLS